jgi:hypothetical protein
VNRKRRGGDSLWFLLGFSWKLKLLLLKKNLSVILFECNSIFLLYSMNKIFPGHDPMYVKDVGFCERFL